MAICNFGNRRSFGNLGLKLWGMWQTLAGSFIVYYTVDDLTTEEYLGKKNTINIPKMSSFQPIT